MHIAIETNPELDDEEFTHDDAHEIASAISKHLFETGHDVKKITLDHGGLKGGTHILNLDAPQTKAKEPEETGVS